MSQINLPKVISILFFSICMHCILTGQNSNNDYHIQISGDSILGGLRIENISGDGISIIDTIGLSFDGVQVVNVGDDGFYVSSAGDDGFQSVNCNGDSFFSISPGDDGFHSSNAGGDGIFTTNSTANAGYFGGDVQVTGTLSKAAGSFKIDHPLDPENKILYHSFVESPDMMNIYNGNTILNNEGTAEITLPEWFCKLNKDYRYQLTCIGGFAQVYIAEKIKNNRFKISGGTANLEISWQVTGIRNDAYAQKYRVPVEEQKEKEYIGQYLQPEAYDLPYEKSYDFIKISNKLEKIK